MNNLLENTEQEESIMREVYEIKGLGAEDLMVAETALGVFLRSRNGAARNVMVGVLKELLKRNDGQKISLKQCLLVRGKEGGVKFLARQTIRDERCPGCGADIRRSYFDDGKVVILSSEVGTFGDLMAYGCVCGRVFGKWEEK